MTSPLIPTAPMNPDPNGYLSPPPPQPPQTVNVPMYQPPIVISQHMQQPPQKSCGLISMGILQILVSSASIGMASYVLHLANFQGFAIAELICGIFFFLTGVFAIHGGNHVWQHQCTIATAATFGGLGVIVAAAAVITNVMALADYPEQCKLCDIHFDPGSLSISAGCSAMCAVAYVPIHIALIALAIVECIFGLIISCTGCCNTCACCCCYPGPRNNGQVLQPPGFQVQGFHLGTGNYAYSRMDANA